MSKELIAKISNDLGIVNFYNEDTENYVHRVLYSAFALWMKTICLDGVTRENQGNHSVSKIHHHTRGEFILNNLLDFFPNSKYWFENDAEHPINFMRERLIRTRDILEIDHDNRIYLSQNEQSPINSTWLKNFGLPNDNIYLSSGLSLLSKNNQEYINLEKGQSIDDFYDNYIKTIRFIKDEWSAQKEYFDPFVKTDTLYQSWVEIPPNVEVYFSRLINKYGQKIYFVEKVINYEIFSCKIDDFIVDSGLLIKVLFYSRYKYGNPIAIEIEKKQEHFILKRRVKTFRGSEETFVQAFGWPMRCLDDTLHWCFLNDFYDDIMRISSKLFLVVKEV